MSPAVLDAPPAATPKGGTQAEPNLLTGFRFPKGDQVGPGDEGKPISREEYAAIDVRSGWQIERAAGKLIVMPRVGADHDECSKPFRIELGGYWHAHRDLIDDYKEESWTAIEDGGDRHPDIAIYLKNSPLAAPGLRKPLRAPDLTFEFVSPGRRARERDYVERRAEYHRIGVREYVIVDPRDRQVLVLRHAPDGYAEAAVLGPGDAYASPLLPGLSIPLAEALGDAG